MNDRELARQMATEKPERDRKDSVERERKNLVKQLLRYPKEEQCAEAVRWMKRMLIDRKRVAKITKVPLESLLKFHTGKYDALDSEQLNRVMYLVTFDRKDLKRRWPVKKIHDRRIKRHEVKQRKLNNQKKRDGVEL